MNTDLWLGALTTLAGAALGGGISFLLSRQQLKAARAQRVEEAQRDKERRSLDRRFTAYADFHTQARSFRNAIRPYRDHKSLRIETSELDALARLAEAASSLVFLLLQSPTTHEACRGVVRAVNTTIDTVHELSSRIEEIPWQELNDEMARKAHDFEDAARGELGVTMTQRTSAISRAEESTEAVIAERES